MRLSDIIEKSGKIIDIPLILTENSSSKMIKVLGALGFMLWLVPVLSG